MGIPHGNMEMGISEKLDWESKQMGIDSMGIGGSGNVIIGLLGGVMVKASDLRSSGRGFDSRPGRYRATYRSTQPSIPPG